MKKVNIFLKIALSLNSTKNLQIDDEMKMAYIPEGTYFMGSKRFFSGTKQRITTTSSESKRFLHGYS